MKLLSIFLFLSLFFKLIFLENNTAQENKKGVYVIGHISRGYGEGSKSFEFPKDSIFVDQELVIEKVLRLDYYDFFGITDLRESLDRYYVIDLKNEAYKDIGKNLNQKIADIPWKNQDTTKVGIDFFKEFENNDIYKIKDTLYEGKKVKKIEYTTNTQKTYEIFLQQNLAKVADHVLFKGIEDKFKGELLKMIVTYPDKQGTATYTKKFIPLKNHEILQAMNKLK
ncbi:hypothetical protein [Flavobacterium quisquiliarum]|uniref:Uncharacterized protein n=1 Tax=Flavobacterium quisquiliarum TaxID=1834436 RepID=A0ABV8W8L1_9FLAO|nr:hypothetical protein [Flavobacterium quisquiliarum]MBW1656461.1 hypothetical protein [Flavobacterium quisquiliarum]NWL03871.1 hypothetical protein [Flavobacterium collinsii]